MRQAPEARSRLQAVRQDTGRQQEQVARELETLARERGRPRVVTAQTVCDWEAGRRLTLDAVVLLCAYWGRSAEELGLIPNVRASGNLGDGTSHGGDTERAAIPEPDRRQVLHAFGATTAAMLAESTTQGDPEHACHVAAEALRVHVHEQPVALVPRRVEELSVALRPHSTLPAVRDLSERLRALHGQMALGGPPALRRSDV